MTKYQPGDRVVVADKYEATVVAEHEHGCGWDRCKYRPCVEVREDRNRTTSNYPLEAVKGAST